MGRRKWARCGGVHKPGGSGARGRWFSSQPGSTSAASGWPMTCASGSKMRLGWDAAGGMKLAVSSASAAQAVKAGRLRRWRAAGSLGNYRFR